MQIQQLVTFYGPNQQTQNICITFAQRQLDVFDVGPALYKCYTNVLYLVGSIVIYPRPITRCEPPSTASMQLLHVFILGVEYHTKSWVQLSTTLWAIWLMLDLMIIQTSGGAVPCSVTPVTLSVILGASAAAVTETLSRFLLQLFMLRHCLFSALLFCPADVLCLRCHVLCFTLVRLRGFVIFLLDPADIGLRFCEDKYTGYNLSMLFFSLR